MFIEYVAHLAEQTRDLYKCVWQGSDKVAYHATMHYSALLKLLPTWEITERPLTREDRWCSTVNQGHVVTTRRNNGSANGRTWEGLVTRARGHTS